MLDEKICRLREKLNNIKLSLLTSSKKNLTKEYNIRYSKNISPSNFLVFCLCLKNRNIKKVNIDSYKNTGCTSM